MDDTFEYNLAAAAIVKDEAPYIEEWLDYHLLAGIEFFYIYDNESSDDLRAKLQPYIAAGKVEYQYYPGKYRQLEAYNDIIRRHKFDVKYMAIIDIDEFILPLQNEWILDIVEDTMKRGTEIGGLAINCKSFGSSGYKKKPEGGVLESYQHRAPDGYEWSDFPWKWDAHVKTIIDHRKVMDYITPHAPKYFGEFYAADEKGRRVDGLDNFVNDVSRIRVNHYFTKSEEEWLAKQRKGKADVAGLRPLEEFAWRDRNEVFDDTILQYRVFCEQHQEQGKRSSASAGVIEQFANLYGELITKPQPKAWRYKLLELLHHWGIYRRELRKNGEDVWQLEIWKDIIFAAMIKAIQSGEVDIYSLELAGSVWQDLMQDADVVQKDFKKYYLLALQEAVKYCREQHDLSRETYFFNIICQMAKDGIVVL